MSEFWWRDSLCNQVDPEMFFNQSFNQEAKRVCALCPVRVLCLADALVRNDIEYGVFGGTTRLTRRRLADRVAAGEHPQVVAYTAIEKEKPHARQAPADRPRPRRHPTDLRVRP